MVNFYVSSEHKYLKQLLSSFLMQTDQSSYSIYLVGNNFDEETISLFNNKINITRISDAPFNIEKIVDNSKELNQDDYVVLVDSDSYLYDLFSVENLVKSISEDSYDVIYSTVYDSKTGNYIYDDSSSFLNLYRTNHLKNHKDDIQENTCKTNDVIFYRA